MPRITRAAVRIREDDASLAAEVPLPATPQGERAPLGDITGNQVEQPMFTIELDLSKPAKKPSKGKKAKVAKKAKREDDAQQVGHVEVLEDDCQSATSSAVEEACDDLRRSHSADSSRGPMYDKRPITPPSKAVKATRKRLSPKAQTPRFNPAIHMIPDTNTSGNENEDSFLGAIESRTPARIVVTDPSQTKDSVGKENVDPAGQKINYDSFLELIVARSPIKPVLRIEDSVEAIDALEDAIEKIGESLPVIPVELRPATKQKAPRPVPCNTQPQNVVHAKKPTASRVTKTTVPKNARKEQEKKELIKRSPIKDLHSTPKLAIAPTISPAKPSPLRSARPTPAKVMSSPTKAPSSKSPVKASPVPAFGSVRKPRVSSITKAPFVPTKSTKAPTTSTFTLPGEVVSQKLKAQREERLKREEEEINKKRQFKARPVPVKAVPIVRSTAATKARLSLARGEVAETGTTRVAPRPRLSNITSNNAKSTSPPTPKQNQARSANGGPKSYTTLQPNVPTKANTSAPRASLSGTIRGQKGREVFSRFRIDEETQEKEKRFKEEAAKKARVEAAERGRLASREWAERMKARKANAATSTPSIDTQEA